MSFRDGYSRTFRNIIVHPTQELLRPTGAVFRGGPAWPHFETQVYPRTCWRTLPWPVDTRPYPASQPVDQTDEGIWCGPVSQHFGHMVADFGMRIAPSSRLDETMPLVFSIRDEDDGAPPPFFWQIIDHLGVDRRRVILIRKPTRFGRLTVLPQAERRFGGGPTRQHLRLMDAITAPPSPPERDIACLFVSRARLRKGRFAGESYLDEVLAAAGVTVFHPEESDLAGQFALYRRARRLIFTEGSALHALQLLGHLDADIVVLKRRIWRRMAVTSLRPRARSLSYVPAVTGIIYGVNDAGIAQHPAGITILDAERCVAALHALGIGVRRFWDPRTYIARRDEEVAAWIGHRLAFATHPGERAMIEARLRTFSLQHLMPGTSPTFAGAPLPGGI